MILFGASGHCKVVLDSLSDEDKKNLIILDDNPGITSLGDYPVHHELPTLKSEEFAIITVGNNLIRKKIAERKLAPHYAKAIHAKSFISNSAKIGEGTVVMALAIINSSTTVGEHCIINSGAVVEHDCFLEDFVHISPNASLAGNVRIGEGSHIGIGASVIQGITIGKWCKVGAGAVIIKDIPDHATVVGNPGKIIKIENGKDHYS